jgi:TPR repeat protein
VIKGAQTLSSVVHTFLLTCLARFQSTNPIKPSTIINIYTVTFETITNGGSLTLIAQAQYSLAWFHKLGRGVLRNFKIAAFWYQKAADQGHAQAQYNLGLCYEHGLGAEKDNQKAAFWFQKATDQGHKDAKEALRRIKGTFWWPFS